MGSYRDNAAVDVFDAELREAWGLHRAYPGTIVYDWVSVEVLGEARDPFPAEPAERDRRPWLTAVFDAVLG